MKVLSNFLLAILAIAFAVSSCSDNDSETIPEDEIKERLSYLEDKESESVSFYYEGDRLTQIKEKSINGETTKFEYEKNHASSALQLKHIFYEDNNELMADGGGSISFSVSDNKIIAKRPLQPGSNSIQKEITLNEDMLPTKITDLGEYYYTAEGEVKKYDGTYYTLLSFDTTKRIIKKELYEIKTSKKISTYTFEYENTVGIVNNINLPIWFCIYWWYEHYTSYSDIFLSYAGNISKITINDDKNNTTKTIEYTYTYNKNNHPVSIHSSEATTNDINNIKY